MDTSRWTKAALDKANEQGDDPTVHHNADSLAAKVMAQRGGVGHYNQFLAVADMLLAAPALVLTEKSSVRQYLSGSVRESAPEILAYYEPAPAPEWLDEAKLRMASQLWHDNSLAMIGVLYALSLPAAYLYRTGVPALYETGRLAKHEYIFQRIYETGLFVDAVMDEDGIQVLTDYAPGEQTKAQRFLWGRGYLAAKKVRFLHASIRFMLEHPPQADATAEGESRTLTERLATQPSAWDREQYRTPINQEQLALVLLTFGYLIPVGLERWGCRVSRERKEAFLHLWRVVGHVLGIRDDLMTDDWDEAAALTTEILSRQAAPSTYGQLLTVALMDFMRSYLPHLPEGLRQRLAAHLVVDQVKQLNPDYPAMILPPDDLRAVRRPVPRLLFGALRTWLRIYYFVRDGFVTKLPFFGDALLSALHRSSEELVESWRDQFQRRPFDLSKSMSWDRTRDFTPESEARLGRWRRKVFNSIGIAVFSLFLGVALLLAQFVLVLVPEQFLSNKLFLLKAFVVGTIVFTGTAWLWMKWRLPKVLASRPSEDQT